MASQMCVRDKYRYLSNVILILELWFLFGLDSKITHPEALSVKREAMGKNGSYNSAHKRNTQGNNSVNTEIASSSKEQLRRLY